MSLLIIHSIIHNICKAPLQEIFKKSPQRLPQPSHGDTKSVLSNLQNTLSLSLGKRRTFKGSPFQVEGPTMENARSCLIAVTGTRHQELARNRRTKKRSSARYTGYLTR